MFDEQDRKYFYDEFKNNGYQVGSYDDFKKDLNNKEDRDWYYNEAKNMGYDVGTQADFDKMVLEADPSSIVSSASASPSSQSKNVQEKKEQSQYPKEVMDAYNSPDNKPGNFKDLAQLNEEYQRGKTEKASLISQALDMIPKVDAGNIGREQKVGGMISSMLLGGNMQQPQQLQQPQDSGQQVQQTSQEDTVREQEPAPSIPGVVNSNTLIDAKFATYLEDWKKRPDKENSYFQNLVADLEAEGMNPDEAIEATRNALGRYANRSAMDVTGKVVSALPDDTVEGAEKNIEAQWYSHGVQDKLKQEAQSMGISYDDYVAQFLKPAIVQSLVQKYGRNYRNIAEGIATRLYSHEEHVQDRLMNQDINDALSDVINKYVNPSVVDEYNKAQEAGSKAFNEGMEGSQNIPASLRLGTAIASQYEANQAKDPQKTLSALQKKFNGLYKNPQFLNDMSNAAFKVMQRYGMNGTLSGNPKQFKPMIDEVLKAQLNQLEVKNMIPKGSAEYIMNTGLGNTIVGKITRKLVQTDYQNWLEDIANQQYQPGFWDNVASGALTFAGDAWSYWLPGAAGGKITKSMLAKAEGKLATDLWAKGMERKMAARAAKALVGKSKGEVLKSGAVHGAVTFGGQSAISKPIDEVYRTGQFDENGKVYNPSVGKILANTLGEVAKQSVVGAIMQGGTVANIIGKGRGLAANILADVGGKVVDSSIMTGQQMLERMAQDPNFKPTGKDAAESFLESMANLTAIGLPGMMGKYARFKDAKEFNRKFDFNEQDLTELKRFGYDGLRDAFEKMGINGYRADGENVEMMGQLTQKYMDLMNDKSVPETLKGKMMAVVEGKRPSSFSPVVDSEVYRGDDGKYYLDTYNKDGGVVERKEYSSHESARKDEKKLDYEKSLNLTSAYENVFHTDALQDRLNSMYQQAADRYAAGEKLSEEDKTAIYLHQNASAINDIIKKQQSGMELTEQEQQMVNSYRHFYDSAFENSPIMKEYVRTFEDSQGVEHGSLRKALEGDGKSRTAEQQKLVEEYQKQLYNDIVLKREMNDSKEEMIHPRLGGRFELPGGGQESSTTQENTETAENPTGKQAGIPASSEIPPAEPPTPPVSEGGSSVQSPSDAYVMGQNAYKSGDNDGLKSIDHNADVAELRLQRAFGSDEKMIALIYRAIEEGRDMEVFVQQRAGHLTPLQKDAIRKYTEAMDAKKGVMDAVDHADDGYGEALTEQLWPYATEDGNIVPVTLQNGETAFIKKANEYGGAFITATDENGQPVVRQVSSAQIKETGTPVPFQDYVNLLAAQKHEATLQSINALFDGSDIKQGDTVEIAMDADTDTVEMQFVGYSGDGKIVLSDGRDQIALSKDEYDTMRTHALRNAINAELDAEDVQRTNDDAAKVEAEKQERYKKGIWGYAAGQPDYADPQTDPKVAAEYLQEASGDNRKALFSNIAAEKQALQTRISQLREHIANNEEWLSLNADLDPRNAESRTLANKQMKGQITDLQIRLDNWNKIRSAVMTPEEATAIKNDRTKKIADAGVNEADIVPVEGREVAVLSDEELKKQYPTMDEASDYIVSERKRIYQIQNDEVQREIDGVDEVLNRYKDGEIDLEPAQIKELNTTKAQLMARQQNLTESAKDLKAQADRLNTLYRKENMRARAEQMEAMSPAERRAVQVENAVKNDNLSLLNSIYEDVRGATDFTDTEPNTLEEYVASCIGRYSLNYEGKEKGGAFSNGLQQETGLGRADFKKLQILAKEGEGQTVAEFVQGLYNHLPQNLKDMGYTDQDIRNAFLSLIGGADSYSDLKNYTLNNRIADAERNLQALEQQEAEMMEAAKEMPHVNDGEGSMDNQGNPVNEDGTLKLDKIKSVDDLTDDDFLHPVRNVQMPTLSKKVADAIGTDNKPVIIKKNIFERNYMRHKDVTPKQSKAIFKAALYNPDLYGQNQKSKRPYNWVLINTKDEQGKNRTVLLEVNPNKDNVEIVHWHFVDERGLEKIKKQVAHEDGQLLILPSNKEEVGALSDPMSNLSAAKIDNSSETSQGKGEKFSERLQKAIAETETEPSEAQKKAGNYKKGHLKFGGYDFFIETPKGATRSGKDEQGKPWSVTTHYTYGYILGKKGVDGDHIDMFINDGVDLDKFDGHVMVIDQVNPKTGEFDKHMVMYGFPDWAVAEMAYIRNYPAGWKRLSKISSVSKAAFDEWLETSDRKTKTFREYALVKFKVKIRVSYDPKKKKWNGMPYEVISDDKPNRFGIINGFTKNPRIDAYHNTKTGSTWLQVETMDNHAETPERINAVLEKEGYEVLTNGESSGFVEFDNYWDAEKFANHVNEVERYVHSPKDNQGNPVNEDGTLKLDKIKSVDDLTDDDFLRPTRNVELPAIPKNVDEAIGANGKSVIIKKNIFEKNQSHHDFPTSESRVILRSALYNPDLTGQTQPSKKPNHWVAIKLDEKSPITVLEVNEDKEHVEVVGWYTLDQRNLDRIKRQAERNGGELIVLSPNGDKVESLSTPTHGLPTVGKGTNISDNSQGKGEKFSLSEKKASNGEQFYQDESGNIDLAQVPDEVFSSIGYTKAPFRLTPSMIEHMLARHNKELKFKNENEAIRFVRDVIANFDHVRLGNDGALVFSIENGRNRTGKRAITVLINSDNGEFYGLKTSGYEAIKGLEKRPLLWERGAKKESSSTDAASASVSTSKSSISGEQSGSASHQSIGLSGKGTNISDNSQGKGEKISENLPFGAQMSMDELPFHRDVKEVKPSDMTEAQQLAYKTVSTMLKKAGIPVKVISNEDMEKVAEEQDNLIVNSVMNSNGRVSFLRTYHGSGADFTEFDFDHINEGAGSQAFGWGGYVTSSKEIGKSYIDMANMPGRGYVYTGNASVPKAAITMIATTLESRPNEDVKGLLQNRVEHFSSLLKKLPDNKFTQQVVEKNKLALDYIDKIDLNDFVPRTENLYEVNIPDDNGKNYLDWDAKVGARLLNKVNKQLEQLGKRPINPELDKRYKFLDGNDLYCAISIRMPNDDATYKDDKAASKFLSSLGYVGIKYKAGRNFGGIEEGDMNYVIFKPEDMKIADHTKFARGKGVVYGYTDGKEIVLNQEHLNPNTPIHEYQHIWRTAAKEMNPELIEHGDKLIMQTQLFADLKEDPNYKHLSDEKLCDEAFARLTGEDGAKILEDMAKEAIKENPLDTAKELNVINKLKDWLKKFWYWTLDTFTKWKPEDIKKMTLEDIRNLVLRDLAQGVDPRNVKSHLAKDDAISLRQQMEDNAEQERVLEHTEENWLKEFGKDGRVSTPIGSIKLGENQYKKAGREDRIKRFGLLKPTLERPDVILEKSAPKEDAERQTKYLFIKSFKKADGTKILNYESITVKQGEDEVAISAHQIEPSKVVKELTESKVLWNRFRGDSNSLGENQGSALTPSANNPSGKDSVLNPHSNANIGNNSETAKKFDKNLSEKGKEYEFFANRYGTETENIAKFDEAMQTGNVQLGHLAMANIRRAYRINHSDMKLSMFTKMFNSVKNELYSRYGNLDELQKQYEDEVMAERNVMEAARKKAEEEEAKKQKHLEELSLVSDAELDKRYMDALGKGDDATAREMLDESARRKGYGDVGSEYQGQGAWAAPSNPHYESDEARRADVETNSPDVNLEDMALGYNLQPADYFDNPRGYMNDTAHGLESSRVIKNALDALKRGEKDVKVKVYRAVPTSVKEGKLRNGDWVTPSKKYAEMHGNNRLEGKYRIIEDEVPANQLWWDGNDANEFGFDDGKEYKYKNAKNNRKLNDLVTYDDKDNVILPSQRFNSRKKDIRFMFAGERGAAEADKAEEQTIRMDNLKVAEDMERGKKDAKAIKLATGWERGADGKWRYEVPDVKIKDTIDIGGGNIRKRFEEDMLWNDGKLEKVVDAPELFKLYPQLEDVRISTDAIMDDMPANGSYNPNTRTITIHADELKYLNSILNHEIQHAIQHIEGFAKGGNAESIRSQIQRIIDEEQGASDYAKEQLKQYATLHMLAARLSVYKEFVKSDQQYFKDKAQEYYWDAMNALDDEEGSKLVNEYPANKTAKEIAESGYHVDEAIKELKRLGDEYKDEIPEGNMNALDEVIKLTSALESKTNYELYRALAGEVEARNVEKRLGMTDEERRNSLASETEDVNRDEQIVMDGNWASYSIVQDPKTIEKLDKEETVKVYRAMQVGEDGKLYPPMAAKVKGKFVQPIELGKWEQADERPDLADDKGMFTLNKGNGKSLKAAYNPYLHTSRTPLNDQFSEAQNRPNIVTVEVEVPKSELTSGYKAEKAKDAVGEVEWKAGIIQGQLTGKRKVILSRWDKPVRIVPDNEVADVIVNDMFKGKNITMPTNVVTPSLRKELEKRGVPFVETDNRGRIIGGENDGVHYSKVYGKKANLKFKFGDSYDYEKYPLGRVEANLATKEVKIVPVETNHGFKNYKEAKDWAKQNIAKVYTEDETNGKGLVRISNSAIDKFLSQSAVDKSDTKDVHLSVLKVLPEVLKESIDAETHPDFLKGVNGKRGADNGMNKDVLVHRCYGAVDIDGKAYRVKITLKEDLRDKSFPHVTHSYEATKIELLAGTWENPSKSPSPNTNNSISGTKLLKNVEMSYDKDKKLLDESEKNGISAENERNIAGAAVNTANKLGGAEANVYTSLDDVPEEYRPEVEQGAKGWYDPETHTVHVYLPNCADANEAQRTVFHEKIGHEGMEVLLGGESGVRNFANFVYKSVGKKLRGKILDFANKYDPDWKNPDRMNVGTQEYIAHLAEEGPHTAEDFSLWTKIKHYLVKALKKLGIHVPGLLNDKDLRYYLMKAGKALHTWDNMPKAKQEAMMAQASNAEIKDALSDGAGKGKPRQKKGESAIQYMKRVMEWKRWKEAREDLEDPEPPQFYDFDKDTEGKKEWERLNKEWRDAHGLRDDEMPLRPERKEGETDEDFLGRYKEWEKWNTAIADKENPMPDMFSFEKERQKAASQRYEDWLARHELLEQQQADLDLYEGKIYPAETNPEADGLEQRVMQDLAEVTSTDVSKEGAARTVKHAVIHRRKNMEEASADDAIYINDVKNRIEKMAESGAFDKLLSDFKGEPNKAEELAEAIPYIIEAPRRLRDIAHDLNNTGAFDKGHLHIQTTDVESIQPFVEELAAQTAKKHTVLKNGEEVEVYDDPQAVSEVASKMAQAINRNHQGEENFVPIDGTDILNDNVLPLVKQQVVPRGIDYQNLSPEMQATIDSIRDWYNYTYDWLKDNHTLREDTGFNTDYVNHIWDKEKSDKQAYAMYVENRQRTKSPNEKPRTISTLMEGINAGLVPKTTDITKMMAYYSRSNIEAWANKTMLQEVSGLNVVERDENGDIISSDPLLSSVAPFNLEQYKYFEIPGVGPVWVYNVSPKEIKIKNPITDKEKVLYSEASAGDRFGVVFDTYQSTPFWKFLDTTASSMKKLELGFSGFHAGALTEVYMVQNAVEFGPKKAMANFMKYIFADTMKTHQLPCFANPEDFQEAASHLVKFGATNDYAAADVQNMFDNFRDGMTKIQEKLDSGNVLSKAGATASLPFKIASQMLSLVNKGMDRALWDFLHDGLKLATYNMRAEKTKERAKAKGWTAEQLSKALDEDGQFVNDMFGGQHWDVLGASHRALRYAGRFLLSPDWNTSTTRHFLALTGYGSVWNEATMENFTGYYKRLWSTTRGNGTLSPDDWGRTTRQLSSLLCYGIGFMVFYEAFANGINAAFRAMDEEKEREKAEETRRTNPGYRSPYELAYPDGMKWYDYLMRGNTLGQQSKIFLGRYADGTEMYIRHGKQFREVPEYLFNHKGELEFPGPMVQRMLGKANPLMRMTLDDINYLSDFQASHADQELQQKYGKTIGLLYKDALYWAPFLIPSQENKEFKAVDFFFPSSKGFSAWKAQDYFKNFILSGDMEGVMMAYQSCQKNGINAEKQLQAAITSIKAMEAKEMQDGVTSLQIATQRFDKAKSVTEKRKMREKMRKFLSQSEYKAFTQQEAMDMVRAFQEGVDPKELMKSDSKYLMIANAKDVTEDWRIQQVRASTKGYDDKLSELKDADKAKAGAFRNAHANIFKARKTISKATAKMNKLKKKLGEGNDEAIMKQIRTIRKDLLKDLNGMEHLKEYKE